MTMLAREAEHAGQHRERNAMTDVLSARRNGANVEIVLENSGDDETPSSVDVLAAYSPRDAFAFVELVKHEAAGVLDEAQAVKAKEERNVERVQKLRDELAELEGRQSRR
ncbi:MAG: hypothetical protein M9905_03030 [Rhizobiaceae bacterium]|nr:hypothetical protein [Rhizobiaceae bacterium]